MLYPAASKTPALPLLISALEKKPSECLSVDKTVHCNNRDGKHPAGGLKEQIHLRERKCKRKKNIYLFTGAI